MNKSYAPEKYCDDVSCKYYNIRMELNCSYSEDNSKCIKERKPLSSHAVLAEVRAVYNELLEDAMYLYQYYPNNFRKSAEEYFKKEIEMQKKLSEHFS